MCCEQTFKDDTVLVTFQSCLHNILHHAYVTSESVCEMEQVYTKRISGDPSNDSDIKQEDLCN